MRCRTPACFTSYASSNEPVPLSTFNICVGETFSLTVPPVWASISSSVAFSLLDKRYWPRTTTRSPAARFGEFASTCSMTMASPVLNFFGPSTKGILASPLPARPGGGRAGSAAGGVTAAGVCVGGGFGG